MKQQLYIPACHKYLLLKDGTPDYQRMFSVSKAAYNLKYPDQEPDSQSLFDFLQANQLFPSALKLEDLDIEKQDLCFSVISQYKCNAICQLCGFSPLYTNQLENEETTLLGFAICNWKNLKLLLDSGVTCRLFRARIPVSEKSAVSVVPLNRLAFEYLEKIPKSQEDLLDVPSKIVTSLKENNKGKLSSSDFKIITKYLENLYTGSYQHTKLEDINTILKKHYKLALKSQENSDPTKIESSKPGNQPPIIIEGFLGTKKPVKTTARTIQQEAPGKKTEPVNNNNIKTPSKSPEPLTTNSAPKEDKCKTDTSQNNNKPEITGTYNKSNIHVQDFPSSQTEFRKIKQWKITDLDFHNHSVVNLENTDSHQIDLFKDALLRTPLLPIEVVEYENKKWIMIYALEKYYLYETSNLLLVDVLIPYITKSRFRKLLCFEPYELFSYLSGNDIFEVDIFSFRIYTNCCLSQDTWASSPKDMLCLIYPYENPDQASEIRYCLRNYIHAYKKFTSNATELPSEQASLYVREKQIAYFMGYSFDLSRILVKSKYLFQMEKTSGYQFEYILEDSLKSPYVRIQFSIRWNSSTPFDMGRLLQNLVVSKIVYEYDCHLLTFTAESLVIAVPEKNYATICEAIYHLSYEITKKSNNLPLTIDEH